MSKVISSTSEKQEKATLFELVPIKNKQVRLDFSAPDLIVIDADDTNANTFGTQQLTLFNAYYGEYCYMPLLLFEGQSGKMILPILRPGRTNKAINISGGLTRLIGILKKKCPHTKESPSRREALLHLNI